MDEYITKDAALACFSDWIDRYGHEHTADEMVDRSGRGMEQEG